MARLLALDWDHQQLHIVAATTGAPPRVHQAVVWQEARSPQLAEAEALGKELRERLEAAGIHGGGVLACLGRDRVIVKEIRYPATDEADEPGVVRFQVAKELTDSVEDVVIDYVPLGEPATNSERRAAALIIRAEVLKAYQVLCQAAGLKLLALTPRPLGTFACWKELAAKGRLPLESSAEGACVVLTVTERWAEMCVIRGGRPVFSRSLTPGPGLAGEIRRNLAVYAGQALPQPVRQLLLSGGPEQAALREHLESALGLPTALLDPFAAADCAAAPGGNLGGFAAAMGLVYTASARGRLLADFAHPREPKAPSDPNKRRVGLLAGAAAVLLIGLGSLAYAHLSLRDREIQELVQRKSELDKVYNGLQPDARRIQALEEWTKTQVNWLDELYDMTDRIPNTDALRLTELVATAGDPQGKTQIDKAGKIVITGVTGTDSEFLNHLRNQLVSDFQRVSPSSLRPNRTGQEARRFPQQFTTSVEIEARKPDKYVRKLPDPVNGPDSRGASSGNAPAAEAPGREGGRP